MPLDEAYMEAQRLISAEPPLGAEQHQPSLAATLEDVDNLSELLSGANLTALEEIQV